MAEFDPFRILRLLLDHRVDFVLIGGLSAQIRGSPRMTGDLDICYGRDQDNLERLAAVLQELKATLRGAPTDLPFRLVPRP